MKAKLIFIILFSFFAVRALEAQTKVKKKDINRITDQAEEAFYNEDYRKALSLYQQLFQMNPEGADYYNYQIALCYLYSNIDNEKAMSYIDMAKESMAETPLSDFYYYNLGKSYHLNNKYEEAINAYENALNVGVADKELRNEIETQIQVCRNAIEITKNPLNVKITNVDEPVNTQYAEYRPLITADESMLVFTSRREGASNGKLDVDGRNYEDIYYTERDELGYWKQPEKISSNINTELHEASVGLSADGTELLIYKGNPNAGGLFVSRMVGTEWANPQMLGENINSKKYQEPSASISADGKYIYFVSNRKGTIGEKDIWRAGKESTGEWGAAENLGTVINTGSDEESPFIHPDGKTLYFSSKGHSSMGGYDIFKSVYENGQWSKPENIGYPINTPGDDLHFVLTADGRSGYFTSSRTGTLGEQDIYKVGFEVTVPLILVKGVVKKEEPGEFKVTINIIDKQTGKLEDNVYSPNPVTGKYLMILPPGKNYDMVVEAENYQPYVININLPNQTEFYELYQEILLRKITKAGEVAQEITVTNYFDNIREAKKTTDSPVAGIGNVASPDYLEVEMKKLMAVSGKQGKNSDSARAGLEKLILLTDKVSDNFDKVLEARLPSEVLTSTYSKQNEKMLQQVNVGGKTISVVPSASFASAGIDKAIENREKVSQTSELAQLKADLDKAKNTPKTGNYILDLANERYIENLEEEIAAIEGGYAMVKKEKEEDYAVAVKKETGIYGTQTTAIIDKEKELAEREAEVARKEAELSGKTAEKTAEMNTGKKGTPVVTSGSDAEAKEKELAEREKAIAEREAKLNAREKELAAREAALAMKEAEASAAKSAAEKSTVKETVASSGNVLTEKVIYFDYNKSDIMPQYNSDLDNISSNLSGSPLYKVEISAHTDSKGTDDYNLMLSKKRAENVMKYFVSKGIQRSRISMKYLGESQPLAPNANPDGTDNPEGRDKNRRAEIRVKSQN